MLTGVSMVVDSADFKGARAVKNAFSYKDGDFKPGILNEEIVQALQNAGYTVSIGLAATGAFQFDSSNDIRAMNDLLQEIL